MMPLGHIGIPLILPLIRSDLDIDIRFLMAGALLSDAIDKPLGHILLPENNGRIFAHTLIFAAGVLALGILWRPGLSLSLGVSFHHILDALFMDPDSALWPLFGGFESRNFEVYNWIEAFGDPYVILTEAAGLVLVLIFIFSYRLYRPERLVSLLKRGKVSTLQNHLYKKDMK